MRMSTSVQADLLAGIRHQTSHWNRNNVTRTEAYLRFYLEHPEVEWALLAHMVSRNGGWNMTDLRGDWLPEMLDDETIHAFFHFLERCNWLIFHDAYAQLLLYQHMKRSGDDLTDLLVPLGISRFMQPVWRMFLQTGDKQKLTHGLIVNEQQYIEQRVVMKPFYREEVLDTLPFHLQSFLSLNQVIFPFRKTAIDERLRLCGISVHRFASLNQRIRMGKNLYRMLFDDRTRLEPFTDWAKRTPHSGSRADYWPDTFSPSRKPDRIYSPSLFKAWEDVSHQPADGVDWFHDERWLDRLGPEDPLPAIDEFDHQLSLSVLRAGNELVKPFAGKKEVSER